MSTVVLKYNGGNTRSVLNALARLGANAQLTDDPVKIRSADRVIFPGVGHASSAMESLRHTGLDKLIPTLTRPVLGICLGMQLMCAFSEEGDTEGLSIFPDKVRRFQGDFKIPHIGWNSTFENSGRVFGEAELKHYYYFVHSYYCELSSFAAAKCMVEDGSPAFSAALERDNFFGVQFHPEKSGSAGQELLGRFLSL